MSDKRRIVVTSALPYANGDIHLGHLVEYIQTDFWVRFQKMRGNGCVYVCADDTHGTPVMIRARAEGITPEELIARSHAAHLKDFTDFEVAFDNYYTTNSPENKALSEQIFAAAEKLGYITGQAAGMAAALASAGAGDVHRVDGKALQGKLKDFGAYLPNA